MTGPKDSEELCGTSFSVSAIREINVSGRMKGWRDSPAPVRRSLAVSDPGRQAASGWPSQ